MTDKTDDKGKQPRRRKSTHPDSQQQIRFNRNFLLILLLIVSLAFFWIVRIFIVSIVLAATFTTLFYPLYKWLMKKLRGHNNIASLITCIIFLLVLLVPLFIVGEIVVNQATNLLQSAQGWLENFISSGDGERFVEQMKGWRFVRWLDLQNFDLNILQKSLETFGSIMKQVISKTYQGLFGLATMIVFILFTMFYFFRDGLKLIDKLKLLSPMHEKYEDAITRRFAMISRAAVKGTLLVGLIQGTIGSITFLLFGINGWALWGVVMIILSVIPMLGAWIVMLPAGAIQIVQGHIWEGIGIIIISFTVVSTIDNFLRPRLVGKTAKMHDLLIFFATLGGISVFGVTGFIIGPIIAAIFLTILDIYTMEFEEELNVS